VQAPLGPNGCSVFGILGTPDSRIRRVGGGLV